MKKFMILFFFLSSVCFIHAQRYIKGMQGIHIEGGIIEKDGFNLSAGFSRYTKHKNRWVLSADYLRQKISIKEYKLPIQQFTASGGYYYMFYSNATKSLFLSLGASVVLGYETVNNGKYLLSDGSKITQGNEFIYGGHLGAELEYYASDKFVILFNIRERVLGGSHNSLFHTTINVGLKIILEKDVY